MKIERKYMAHFLNATFGGDAGTASYVRLGKDLEEYSPELSANVEKKQNILGQTSVTIDSYQKQGEVSPYYAEKGDPLFEKLQAIIDGDLVLDNLKTDIVEVKLWEGVGPGTVAKAYGQGHWAYGQIAAKEYGKTPRGGNNNEILVDDYDRLSGTSCRNGGYTRVSIKKVSSNN